MSTNSDRKTIKVVAAVKEQVEQLMHVFNYPYSIPQTVLAKKICETIGMDKIIYQNSGTEANEAAIKLARKYGVDKYGPEHYRIVTAKKSFHGRTYGAMSATGQPGSAQHNGYEPLLPGFTYAEFNNLQAFKDACDENTTAIMFEPVQGEGGVYPATQEFMDGIREFCTENDILLILDEVQAGWGRTGEIMAYMNYGIKPDIIRSTSKEVIICTWITRIHICRITGMLRSITRRDQRDHRQRPGWKR